MAVGSWLVVGGLYDFDYAYVMLTAQRRSPCAMHALQKVGHEACSRLRLSCACRVDTGACAGPLTMTRTSAQRLSDARMSLHTDHTSVHILYKIPGPALRCHPTRFVVLAPTAQNKALPARTLPTLPYGALHVAPSSPHTSDALPNE